MYFAVSYVNLLDNTLSTSFEEADDAIEAAVQRLAEEDWKAGDGDFDSLDELKEFMFTLDVLIDAVEIPAEVARGHLQALSEQ